MAIPVNSKIRPLERNFCGSLNFSTKKPSIKGSSENDEETTVFRDLHVSAFSKAASISPAVKSVTLGSNTVIIENEKVISNTEEDVEKSFSSSVLHSSTPEKKKSSDLENLAQFSRISIKESNLSSFGEKKNSLGSFSYRKLLNEFDIQRRLTVDKVMRERIQNMYDTSKLIRESLEHLKRTKLEEAAARRLLLERKILDEIHEQEVLNKPKREAEWEKNNLKEAQRIQERNQKVKEAEEVAKKKSEAYLLKRKQVDEILFLLQKEYNQEYKNLLDTIKLCKDKAALADFTATQTKLLKECAVTCEGLLKKCKQCDVSNEDVNKAKNLVETIRTICVSCSKEIVKIQESGTAKLNEEEEEEEEEVKKVETEPAKSEVELCTSSASSIASESDLSDCFDSRSLEKYFHLKNVLDVMEKAVEPLLRDDSVKKFRFHCQKAVNIPVNAISPVSGPHLTDKYLKLYNLLSGKAVEIGDVKISALEHPLGIIYCKYLLAKKFVRQGDLTVSSKPDAAFSIAAVLASLWVDFPDFGELVLAHFQAACPYLAPVFMPQVENQSDEDYHKSLGYQYLANGEVEKQDRFLRRMSGIMRLYAAVIISEVRQRGRTNPLGLFEGWRWISAILNLKPRPDICASLLYDFLEVAGNEMFKAYGSQFKKVLAYICQEYFPKLEKITPLGAGGPMVRLESFLQKILKEESIPPPQGVLPPNFW